MTSELSPSLEPAESDASLEPAESDAASPPEGSPSEPAGAGPSDAPGEPAGVPWGARALSRLSAAGFLAGLGLLFVREVWAAPLPRARTHALFAGGLWALARGLELTLRRGWSQRAPASWSYFVAGAVIASTATWTNPSEPGPSLGPGWIGAWLLLVPFVLRLPRWSGLVGLGVAWVTLCARALAQGAPADLQAVALSSTGALLCALVSLLAPPTGAPA